MLLGLIGLCIFIFGLGWYLYSLFKRNHKPKRLLLLPIGMFIFLYSALTYEVPAETVATDSPVVEETTTSEIEDNSLDESKLITSVEIANDSNVKEEVTVNLNDFELLTENYASLEKEDRTEYWTENINGEYVEWTGILLNVGAQQIDVVGLNHFDEDTLVDGEFWNGSLDYNHFVADFERDIDESEFPALGEEITVTGQLTSRGDHDLDYHWKIYDAELVK